MRRTQKQLFAAGVSSAALALCLACGSGDANMQSANRPVVTLPNDRVEVSQEHRPMTGSYPALWVNGDQTLLDEKALGAYWGPTANSVFVAGDDVYMAGVDDSQGLCAPALWKNGERTLLGLSETNHGGANVCSVFVSGDDVYVGGYQFVEPETYANNMGEGNNRATLWKSSEPTLLAPPAHFGSFVKSVFVDGGDVYAAGAFCRYVKLQEDPEDLYCAYYTAVWKNGEIVLGDVDAPCSSFANSVFVSDGDVYVADQEWGVNGGFDDQVAVLWMNGEPRRLSVDDSRGQGHTAMSVFVSDGDVYVVGLVGSEEYSLERNAEWRPHAILWKNGEGTALSDNFDLGVEYPLGYHVAPSSVYVMGGDVYVAGEESTALGKEAVLWVNDERHSLCRDYPFSTANSVFVKALG